jgi:hypothetical protein
MPIHWDKFSEIEVQGILYQHFISLDYKVDWIHFIEPPKEKKLGCDLVCRRNGETIGVAVKKKPGITDYEQVKRLAQKNYNRKLFIYLETPSISFTEKIRKCTSKVEVLSISDFEKELENHETGLMILSYIHYSDSLFSKLTAKFLLKLANLIKEKTTDNLQRETIKPMPELWQLKDYTAAMSRSIQLLLSILEKDWFYAKTEPKVLYFIFQEVLKNLGSMMEGFCQTWQHLLMKNKCLY